MLYLKDCGAPIGAFWSCTRYKLNSFLSSYVSKPGSGDNIESKRRVQNNSQFQEIKMARTALVLALAVTMMSFTAKAQDDGIVDTIALIATLTPDAQANQLKLKLELWVFNDEPLTSVGMGFSWDNTSLRLDSVVGTPLTISGFPIGPFFYEDGNLALTNANKRFLFGGVATSTLFSGSAAGRRLWASYYLTLSSWATTDVINLDTLTFNDASAYLFVPESQTPFFPIWAGGLTIIDPNAPVDLLLSKDSLHFNSVQGGPAPPFQEFTITSSGGAAVAFTLSENAPWLLVSPVSASTPRTIRLDINNTGQVAGSYIDTIEVNSASASNTPLHVVVTLAVAPPPPTISVTPNVFFFNAIANTTNPDPKILTIKNTGGSILNWTLTKVQPWLNLSPMSGADSGDVEVSIDITGLTLGTYRDTITVSDPAATNNPRKVAVTLSIASDLPVIEVDSTFNFVIVESDVAGIDSTFFGIRNGGGGTMDYWLEWNSPRIFSVVPDSGAAPARIRVKIKIASGTEGNDYYDTVWVYSNQAINSPVPVLLLMHYVANPAAMTVSPTSLNYNLFECAQGPTEFPLTLNFTVYNFGGDAPLNVNIVYESELFTVVPLSGTAPQLFNIVTKDLQLPLGIYRDTIYVHALKAENNPQKLEVTLNVVPGTATPQIHVTETFHTLTAQEDYGPIIPRYFTIQNQFGGCMEWHIDNDITWAAVLDSTGDVPSTIGIFANSFGLSIGQYSDSFYITSPVASNSPGKVKLLLKVWKFHGDNNYDGKLNVLDLVHSISFFFRGSGILPQPERLVGDVNCDEKYNVVDMNYMVNFFFRNGLPPCGNPFKK